MASPNNMVQVTWRMDTSMLDTLIATAKPLAEDAVRHTLDDVKNYINNHWSEESPSSPGNPPAVVTGNLMRSIRVDRRSAGGQFANSDNAVSWSLRVEAEYGAAQEFGVPEINLLPRPYIRPAIQAVKNNLGKYIKANLAFVKPRGVFTVLNPFYGQSVYTEDVIGRLG